ncbi:GNAT family N-acetyltransferase [Paenibacillus eucommiae]|uniref:GNAT superfamily N-acetyltransferase n=1 Tax=Paenibacillus eucommiae TaxID=1355755 RepID=A0ABS4IM48_9BACL|nr:GNAT family N-acetyltransferase [Paenibacillus eucommiae]MBP1988637.1 GNAT superfamily N-acetyltransferase [Paenibacillus eucommiae]
MTGEIAIYKKIEEFSLNAWPALQSFVYDGWLLRFADGFTKRSNSVNPIYNGYEKSIPNKIRHCEDIYSSVGLDTIFKITPYVTSNHIDNLLDELGYIVVDPSSVKMLDLANTEEPHKTTVTVSTDVNIEWLDQLACMNNLSESAKQTTWRLLSPSYVKKGFFTLFEGEVPVACGLGVVEQNYIGLYDIVTDSSYRSQGYGRQLILNMLKWGKANGASHSYLQVVKSNRAAVSLYESLGYQEVYTYWYRLKSRGD